MLCNRGYRSETLLGDTYMQQAAVFAKASDDFFVAGSHLLNRQLASPLPALFLLARSIELALKALLVAEGMPVRRLAKRPYGHNLNELLDRLHSRGSLPAALLTAEEESAISLLSKAYDEDSFGYPEVGRQYLLPRIDLVDEATKKILSRTARIFGT